MDILEIVRRQLDLLPEGPYSSGLKSVLRHIEAATRHLARGQEERDDSAYTDAIYRANQAFEGGIKEAYRVLASKDPVKARPYDIEQYLQDNNIFRLRVLSQFTNYRVEWRNPSIHDYNLDFDEDEAFLAIVSVSAFAKLLIDQILEKIVYSAVASDLKKLGSVGAESKFDDIKTQDRIASIVRSFANDYLSGTDVEIRTETQIIGALDAYLSTVEPSAEIVREVEIGKGTRHRVDMIVRANGQKFLVEAKWSRQAQSLYDGLKQIGVYMEMLPGSIGVLFIYDGKDRVYDHKWYNLGKGDVVVIAPNESPKERQE